MSKFFEDRYSDHFIEVNGLRLHYTEWHTNATTPLLLVHGLNVQLHTWDPIADALRNDYRVICVDLRGHGDSDWSRAGYGVQAFVADIHEFARALDIIPFALVGHSLGSRIGMAYGGEHGDTLTHLGLSDAGPEVSRAAALQIRDQSVGAAQEVHGFRSKDEVKEYFRESTAEWQPIFQDLHAEHQVRLNWAGKWIWKADPEIYWIGGSVGKRETPYLWDMCAQIPIPTLILWGENSTLLTKDIVDRMVDAIPKVSVRSFETGHQIAREKPEEYIAALQEYLAG